MFLVGFVANDIIFWVMWRVEVGLLPNKCYWLVVPDDEPALEVNLDFIFYAIICSWIRVSDFNFVRPEFVVV